MSNKIKHQQRMWYSTEDGSGYDMTVEVEGAEVAVALDTIGEWLDDLPEDFREDNCLNYEDCISGVNYFNPSSLQDFVDELATSEQMRDLKSRFKAKGIAHIHIQGWSIKDKSDNPLGWLSLEPHEFLYISDF